MYFSKRAFGAILVLAATYSFPTLAAVGAEQAKAEAEPTRLGLFPFNSIHGTFLFQPEHSQFMKPERLFGMPLGQKYPTVWPVISIWLAPKTPVGDLKTQTAYAISYAFDPGLHDLSSSFVRSSPVGSEKISQSLISDPRVKPHAMQKPLARGKFTETLDPKDGLVYTNSGGDESLGPLAIRMGAKKISIVDSKIINLQGEIFGPGEWHMSALTVDDRGSASSPTARDGHPGAASSGTDLYLFTHIAYKVEGTYFGEPVEGTVAFLLQAVSGPANLPLRAEGDWITFQNQYEDGSVEMGTVLCSDGEAMTGAVILDGTKKVTDTHDVKVVSRNLNKDQIVTEAKFKVGDEMWEFVSHPNFYDPREVNTRGVQLGGRTVAFGSFTRVGEKRKLRTFLGAGYPMVFANNCKPTE